MTEHTALRADLEALAGEYQRRHRAGSYDASNSDVVTDLRALLAAHPVETSAGCRNCGMPNLCACPGNDCDHRHLMDSPAAAPVETRDGEGGATEYVFCEACGGERAKGHRLHLYEPDEPPLVVPDGDEVEALARQMADAFPDSGDDCFTDSAYAGDPEGWESKSEDRDWYRTFATRLLAARPTAAPSGEGGGRCASAMQRIQCDRSNNHAGPHRSWPVEWWADDDGSLTTPTEAEQ